MNEPEPELTPSPDEKGDDGKPEKETN